MAKLISEKDSKLLNSIYNCWSQEEFESRAQVEQEHRQFINNKKQNMYIYVQWQVVAFRVFLS